jgi:hypothetical protein
MMSPGPVVFGNRIGYLLYCSLSDWKGGGREICSATMHLHYGLVLVPFVIISVEHTSF